MTSLGPAVERVKAFVDDGELKPAEALKAIGALVVDEQDVTFGHRSTVWRYRRRVQELGLVLVDGVLEEVEVDLGEALEGCLDAGVWGDDG